MTERARARYSLVADDRTAGAFASVRRNMGRAQEAARGFASSIASVVTGALLVRFVKQILDSQQELGKFARQMDISTEFLSEMRGVLSITGVEWRVFVNSLRQAQKVIDDADAGLSTAIRAFGQLGIRFEDLKQLDVEGQFLAILEALRRMGKGYEQTAAAAAIFGFRNTQVLRIANLSRTEFEKLREEQIALNRSMSEDQTKAAEDAIDSWDRLTQTILAAAEAFTITITPTLETVANVLNSVLKPAIEFVRLQFARLANLIGGIGASLVFLFKGQFSEAANAAKATFQDFVDNIKDTFEFVQDPIGFTDQQARNRLKAAAQRVKQDIDAVFDNKKRPALFEEDINKIREFAGQLRSLISSKKSLERGTSAEVDTTLQSLRGTTRDGNQRLLDKLDALLRVIDQREMSRTLKDIREILARPENQTGLVFG